jgi:hypothetical protein
MLPLCSIVQCHLRHLSCVALTIKRQTTAANYHINMQLFSENYIKASANWQGRVYNRILTI